MNHFRWITYLSLDAPLVALAWQEFVARELNLTLDWHHRVIIGLSVWLGYVADRWFDAWRYKTTESKRHQLHRKYRWPVLALWLIILLVAFGMSAFTLSSVELIAGLALMAFSILVTVLVQKRVFGPTPHLPKAILTALLIAASSTLFPFSNVPDKWLHIALLSGSQTGLFAFNCILIHKWEIPLDQSYSESIDLKPMTIQLILLAVWLVSSKLVIIAWAQFESFIAIPITLSFLTLIGLALSAKRTDLDSRRILADISLLTPILFIWN